MMEFLRDNWHITTIIFLAGGLVVNIKYLMNHNQHINHKVDLLFGKFDKLHSRIEDFEKACEGRLSSIEEWQRIYEKKLNED